MPVPPIWVVRCAGIRRMNPSKKINARGLSAQAAAQAPRLLRPAALALFILAAGAYANTLRNDFVYDDMPAIVMNPAVTERGFLRIFTTPSWFPMKGEVAFRPLTTLSFYFTHKIFGLNPVPFHAGNVLLHAAAVLLAFWLLLRLGMPSQAAFLAALFFALHPIHTEAVAAAANRTELLSACFVFSSLLLHLSGRGILSSICFLSALLAKENAVTALALYPLMNWLLPASKTSLSLKKYALVLIAFILYLALRSHAIHGTGLPSDVIDPLYNPLIALNGVQRFVNVLRVDLRYLWLLLFPLQLCADYSYNQIPVQPALSASNLLAAGAWAALLGLGFKTAKKLGPPAAFLCLFGAATFSIASNWPLSLGTVFAERLLYLPSFAFCGILALLLVRLQGRGGKFLAVAVSILLCLLYGIRAYARNADWKSQLTLFESAAKVSPRSMKALGNYGDALLSAGRIEEGLAALEKAVEINPKKASEEILSNMGSAYLALGNEPKGEEAFQKALAANPSYANAHFSLGLIYARREDWNRSLKHLQAAVQSAPWSALAHYNLGITLARLGENTRAQQAFRAALSLQPDYAQAREQMERLQPKKKSSQPFH